MTVAKGHDAVWPDKLVFAAILLIIAGAMGTLYGLLMFTGATIGGNIPAFFREYPAWASLLGSLAALVTGTVGFRHQTSRICWLGVAGGIGSMAFFGVVPAIAVVAAVMLVLSLIEGEETVFDAHRVEAHEWPDKAFMATAFLTVGALAAIGQGILLFFESSYEAIAWQDTPQIWASFSLLAGLAMAAGAVQCFHLRGGVLGVVGAVLGGASLAFWALGPLMALLALVTIALAYREGEFLIHGSAREARAGAEA